MLIEAITGGFRSGVDRTVGVIGCLLVGLSLLLAQSPSDQAKTAPGTISAAEASAQEFPVVMRQNVVAGKTPIGTKVEAKLTIATLVKGMVIPEGAVFSGEVVDSTAKTKTEASRLAIRMDSVQWKKESKPVRVFLTAWYYPLLMGEDAQDRDQRDRPIMQNPNLEPFPNSRIPHDTFPPARVSENRVAMKDVEPTRDADGTIALTSTKNNLKLDKSTTYVLAAGDLTADRKK
ncbi:MAG: hypothetical protein WCB53_08870 [Terriglobales bacterium]